MINEWILTDPSCNQYRRDISESEFEFKEDRIINPITKETKLYQVTINLDDYDIFEIIDACSTFGYSAEEVEMWCDESKNYALIAECMFELDYDDWL